MSSIFVRNRKYVMWNGVRIVPDKPCTSLSTDSVDKSRKCLEGQELMLIPNCIQTNTALLALDVLLVLSALLRLVFLGMQMEISR